MTKGAQADATPKKETPPESAALLSLAAALKGCGEAERYHLLASAFSALAEQTSSGKARAEAGSDASLKEVTGRLQILAEQKAALEDDLAGCKADLAHRTAQWQAEQARAAEQARIIDEQRKRVEALQKQRTELQTELDAKSSTLHQTELERERILLRLQRLETQQGDESKTLRLESDRRALATENERVRCELEQLRAEKDREIERLKGELAAVGSATVKGVASQLKQLWERLAAVKPPLAEGYAVPTVQAAERLVDAFIELVRFVDDFDKSMRVFLDKYTRYLQSVKVPWDVYAKGDDVYQLARQAIAVKDPRPVGLLKMKLRMLHSWCQAAMIGADAAVESIASELDAHLRGELGLGVDANRRIRDFLREDGHEKFLERIRELRSRKLAETFGRGA
jgi:hypothetical protein